MYFIFNIHNCLNVTLKISDVDHNWWKDLVTKKDLESVYPYSKFIMMFSLLQECEEIGDKVLVLYLLS